MKNILIVKLSAIGDVIHALPTAYALKETFPGVKITWVVEPPAYDLLMNNPCIDEVIVFEKKKFKTFVGFLKHIGPLKAKLQKQKYDAVLDLQGLFKSAALAWLSRSDVKLGCANMREGSNKVSRSVVGPHANGHIVERYLDVVRELGCSVKEVVFPLGITDEDASMAKRLMKQAGADIENPYIVLAVGANWPNKRWPVKYYAEIVDWIYSRNGIPVLIGAGGEDERLAAEISVLAQIPPVTLVGRTRLKQLAYVIKNSKAVIGGDTGTVHLAAALEIPTVMLLGPTDINRNGPYKQCANAIEVSYDCKHCWKRVCRFQRDCLSNIKIEQVTRKLEPYC